MALCRGRVRHCPDGHARVPDRRHLGAGVSRVREAVFSARLGMGRRFPRCDECHV